MNLFRKCAKMTKYKKKFFVLLLNLVFVCLFVFCSLNYSMEKAVANAFVRDSFFVKKECMNFLPRNVNFLYRKKRGLDYLVFPSIADSVQENYVYILDYPFLKKNAFVKPMALELGDYEIETIFDSVFFMDSVYRWCYKKEMYQCFLADRSSTGSEFFATRLDSVRAYLKCNVGRRK